MGKSQTGAWSPAWQSLARGHSENADTHTSHCRSGPRRKSLLWRYCPITTETDSRVIYLHALYQPTGIAVSVGDTLVVMATPNRRHTGQSQQCTALENTDLPHTLAWQRRECLSLGSDLRRRPEHPNLAGIFRQCCAPWSPQSCTARAVSPAGLKLLTFLHSCHLSCRGASLRY